ncbi:class I SAM-dependent methyltransferase [Neptuniibacter halophilus]|uniref:class I SAM-dependent methyltransferase n=1 Tax=Neptuniibacter halophilus TaxID=651666 RepID=UPI0025739C1E|nr:class I SAM-dependent methyltransferase [Neptuniibacter halophilus]
MAQNFPDTDSLADDKAEDLKVCQCLTCGLVQLDCEPVAYFQEVIRAAAFSDEMKAFRLKQFARFIEAYQLAGKRILEVGAGAGEYLDLMQEQGVDAWGIEAGVGAGHHPRISKSYLDSDSKLLDGAPYDGFFCLNFLEHMPDLKGSLRAIASNLKPGATGLIEVPNFDMILEKKLFSEFIRDHLFYFTETTLVTLLQQTGFEVLSCKPVWHDYSLSAIVKKRSTINLTPLINAKSQIERSVDSFTRQFRQKEIVIWGAGHQALAVINMLQLKHKVACVVDSATFKQNKYTPGSHIPIYSPQRIHGEEIKAVIVMAASYSDEVAAILRRDYRPELRVAVLRDDGLEEV